jgi:tetratricopeptide (TPR) repeat protein/predicted Ser/Thr protein kinase
MDPVLAGSRLSHYRIERLLGAGGMGSVYLARDLSLDRPVAIKFIADDKAGDDHARRRLIREAQAAAALDHPNICTIHEVVDDPSGPAYIVMQYVEGETLAATLRAGPLERRQALSLVNDLGSALATAERCGIVHRDIKPQNIIVTNRGAKLLDFGIARVPETAAGGADAETRSKLTAMGAVPGTLAYMSPEQVLGKPADHRSDLFSLGVVLYECLSGHPPFAGDHPYELANQILNKEPPPLSQTRPEISQADDELCRRLLAKDREERFQSANELLGDLRLLGPDGNHSAHNSDPVPAIRRRLPIAGVAVALLAMGLLVATGWWWWSRPTVPTLDPQTARYFRQGVDALRDGTPHTARLMFLKAIEEAPTFPSSHIRLAEAEIELDESENAQQRLMRVSQLVPNEARLPFEDRIRVAGVRALTLRDVDTAVDAYRRFAESAPNDPGAWLDVGRAQEVSGRDADALDSYAHVLRLDARFAAAHLRRATILGRHGQHEAARAAFDEAERLYRSVASVEGQVETLIRRATYLNGNLRLKEAREAADRARVLADELQSDAQSIRARLLLSSVTASEGGWKDAQTQVESAVDAALAGELDAVAAEGLVDLANVLVQSGRATEAERPLSRAIELAERRNVARIAERARLQRAYVLIAADRPAEGIAAAQPALEYFRANQYRRYELTALSILARAHEQLGQLDRARAVAEQALQMADDIKDENLAAEALENLAGIANAKGELPAALAYRQRSLEIHRRQNLVSMLGYDLVNTADLLIRLGRGEEAGALLDEIEAGARNAVEPYLPRLPRAHALRALNAAIQRRPDDVRLFAARAAKGAEPSDSTYRLAAALVAYTGNSPTRGSATLVGDLSSPLGREIRYWDLLSRLSSGQVNAPLRIVEATLGADETSISHEFEWRIAAIGAVAAERAGDASRARALRDRAAAALARVRKEWQERLYENRPDLVDLRRKAGLDEQT